ncbi:MAG: hypothetical protein IPN54_10795 [Bacteroidetes bacterium]|nr:hypothetical protein [Bacteroidota bacterium]
MNLVWVHSNWLADIGGYYMWKNFQPDRMLWQEKTNLNPGKAGISSSDTFLKNSITVCVVNISRPVVAGVGLAISLGS